MNHKEMNAELASMCGQLGVWCWINAGEKQQRHGKGWIDGVALGNNGALFIENKTADGRRTLPQIHVAGRLTMAGLAYRLYRPDDYADGTVRQDLEAIA